MGLDDRLEPGLGAEFPQHRPDVVACRPRATPSFWAIISVDAPSPRSMSV